MTGIILAGGENRRMGAEKAFLDIAGKPLIEHILRVFLERFEQTIIVTRSPERYRGLYAAVVNDALETSGPLTGIYSGLLHARTERVFVAACDMPCLSSRLIAYMEQQAGEFDAVVPLVKGLPEPLHAIYHRRSLPVILNHIQRAEQRVAQVLEHLRVRYLTEREIIHYDPQLRSFRNLNTPEEYKEAVCSDWACRNS
jgi:molybdopterin-guanine dinucleotide biosynthesis protein A